MNRSLLLSILAMAVASSAFAQTNPAAQRFFDNWDKNADGTVTTEEAVSMRGDVFTTFDANEDGTLDAEEHVLFDEARANDIAAIKQDGPRAIITMIANGMSREMNDTNADGTVTQPEFVEGAALWLDKIDTNRDGVVTIADFEAR